jgi:hypothetical protein
MRIKTEATPRDIELAFHWIGALMGAELDKRVAAFERQERSNPLLGNHFREHFALEFALAEARKYRKNTGRLPKGNGYDDLYGFLIPAHRSHAALPANLRGPFEGRLFTALSGAHGIRPFAYEVSIATHLMQRGWDVEFADYAGLGRFDLLARRGGIEVELECKATSGDTGRKVHRQEVNRLADLLLPMTQRLADHPGCHLLRITVPRRLGKSNAELAAIASAVEIAIQQRETSNDVCSAGYQLTDLTSWPDPRHDQGFRAFFEQQFGIVNAHLLVHGRPGVSVVGVTITSEQADTVIDTIADQAKEAADQCTGTRPALIALHLIDPMSEPQLEELLKTLSGIHRIAAAVFNGANRLHVDSIMFTVPQRARSDASGATWLSGHGAFLENPNPKFPCADARGIFRKD